MKLQSLLCVLALGLLANASAQMRQISGMLKLPVTPQLKREVTAYAKQVTGRGCSDYIVGYVPDPKITPKTFDAKVKEIAAGFDRAVKRHGAGNFAISSVRSGESGYIYVNDRRPKGPDALYILAFQKVDGKGSMVVQACQLK